MEKKSTKRLPPHEDSLRMHIQRCNYVIHTCLNYKSQDAPPSQRKFGWKVVDAECEPIRYNNVPLPESTQLSSRYELHENSDSNGDSDDEHEHDFGDSDSGDSEREYDSNEDESVIEGRK